MSKPTITECINGYGFKWENEKLTINVSRVRVHSSDGRITGELLVTSPLVSNKPIYPQTSFNFNSAPTRRGLIKTLNEAYPKFPWDDIINQLCLGVVDRVREGEPAQEGWTSDESSPPEFLLEPLLYKGLPTIVFGEKAVCKSLVADVIYTCLILPWQDNPFGWTISGKPVKALICDYEGDYDVTQYYLKRLQNGMGLPPFPISYLRCNSPLADNIEQIQKRMAKAGAEVLIIDSLAPAVGGDITKSTELPLRFNAALRQLKCSSLIIGQTSKDKDGKHKSVFGSAFFEYYARNIFELRKVQEEGEDIIDIAFFNTFCNLGRRQPPMGFRVNFDKPEAGIGVERTAITAPELIERMGTQARILDLLKLGPMTTLEIKETLNISRGAADMSLKRLKDKTPPRIVKLDDKWGLLAREEMPLE